MDIREREIAKTQTALWMAEKLARLCRELVRARDANDDADITRLAGEVESLITSADFIAAVQETGRENFYPDILRKKLESLQMHSSCK